MTKVTTSRERVKVNVLKFWKLFLSKQLSWNMPILINSDTDNSEKATEEWLLIVMAKPSPRPYCMLCYARACFMNIKGPWIEKCWNNYFWAFVCMHGNVYTHSLGRPEPKTIPRLHIQDNVLPNHTYLNETHGYFRISWYLLTLVLLNPDMPCLCKQCRSRTLSFWRSQMIWICPGHHY